MRQAPDVSTRSRLLVGGKAAVEAPRQALDLELYGSELITVNFHSLDFARRVQDLAPAYLHYLSHHSTDSQIGELVLLYGTEEIEERNDTHEVAEYIPDYICIGNDSGDHEFFLKRDGGETVYCEDPGSFSAPSFEVIHSSFPKWLAEGCPLPEEAPPSIPIRGRIWLLTGPPGGMKDMLGIKKALAMNWSIPQMRQSLENLPALLIEEGMPYVVHLSLVEHRVFRPLLGFSWPGSDTIHSFADFDLNDGAPVPRP